MTDHVNILKTEILSDNWYVLKKITYEYTKKDGSIQVQNREAYDRGNGATILLYNKEQQTVILTKQFRLPTFLNGNESRNDDRNLCRFIRQRQPGRLYPPGN